MHMAVGMLTREIRLDIGCPPLGPLPLCPGPGHLTDCSLLGLEQQDLPVSTSVQGWRGVTGALYLNSGPPASLESPLRS